MTRELDRKSGEIAEIAVLKEQAEQSRQHNFKMERAIEEVKASLNAISIQMALGNQRFDDNEEKARDLAKLIDDHEVRITGNENDKRGLAGIAAGLVGIGGAAWAIIKSWSP